jgi:hypothetical protein
MKLDGVCNFTGNYVACCNSDDEMFICRNAYVKGAACVKVLTENKYKLKTFTTLESAEKSPFSVPRNVSHFIIIP